MLVRLRVFVRASSRENRLVLDSDRMLVAYVNAPPVKGKANQELVRWLSRRLRIPSSHIKIVAGLSSREKIIEISGVEMNQILELAEKGVLPPNTRRVVD